MASAQKASQDPFAAAVARRRDIVKKGAGRIFYRNISAHLTWRFGVILNTHEDASDGSLMVSIAGFVQTIKRERRLFRGARITKEWKREVEVLSFEDFEKKFGNPELVDIYDNPEKFFGAVGESFALYQWQSPF